MALPRLYKNNGVDQTNIYRDFPSSMEMNPITNDLVVNIDVKAVKESIKNILLTNKGSRVFNPTYGGNIKALLFENKYNLAIFKIMEDEIKNIINRYEPRATVQTVDCVSSDDDNILKIVIYFYVINNEQLQSTTILMEKIR